ncbi:MAG TPA: hypothetical protein VJ600_01290 [Holophagaceae bacterium]|nr:hypothetical protein [Holophagaceae bacterium]
MKPLTLSALCLALAAAPAFAQGKPAEPPTTDQKLQELERKVDILSRELEQQKTGATFAVAGEQGEHGLGAAASKVYAAAPGLSIGGYGEILYTAQDSKLQDGTRVGSEKSLDALRGVLYVGFKFSDRIVFNSEMEWEHGGFSDEHPEGEAIMEFAYLDFLIDKRFNVRAGQMLVPMGFINELHEPPAFLGAQRPFVEQEGGIIPTTWHENGVGVHGDLPGNLSYRIYVMNGLNAEGFSAEGIGGGRQDANKANAHSLAWTGRLDWTFMPGASVGGSFYTGNSNQSGDAESLRTTVADLHAEWRAYGFQVRGLYARSTNAKGGVEAAFAPTDPQYQVGTKQWGGYLEVGYDVLRGRFGKQALIPYARWERLDTQAEVAAGVVPTGEFDQSVLTGGVSWKPIPNVAVKADVSRIENHANTGRNQFNLALGYYF